MATYHVEARRIDNGRDVVFRAHRATAWSVDDLWPGTTAVFRVEGCRTANAAVALVIERAAGKPVTVTQVFPRPERAEAEADGAVCGPCTDEVK